MKDVDHGVMLGSWVRARRAVLGLTAERVTSRMGEDVPLNFVTQLENGGRKRMIGQPRLGQLARALDSSTLDLLVGAGVVTEEEVEGMGTAGDIDTALDRLGDELAARAARVTMAASPEQRALMAGYFDQVALRAERRRRAPAPVHSTSRRESG